jgi:hypothetical protein
MVIVGAASRRPYHSPINSISSSSSIPDFSFTVLRASSISVISPYSVINEEFAVQLADLSNDAAAPFNPAALINRPA